MRKIRDFFWLCSGADRDLLIQCPTETSKYVGIGATVLFTGVFAALAAFYALYTIFENIWPSLVVGIIWGAMIFNLDRYIVSSMRKVENRWKEFRMAIPRLILAIMIAVVISKPLELRIFDKEIEAEFAIMEQEYTIDKENLIKSRYISSIDSLRNDIQLLKKEIQEKTQTRDELRRIAQQEADGTGGSLRRNAGPIYRIKKADADRVDLELADLTTLNDGLISEKLQQISSLEKSMNDEMHAGDNAYLAGLASRMEAFNRLTRSSTAIWIANWFIILLFVAIETAPVLVKLMSIKGPYDYLLQAREYEFKGKSVEAMARSNSRIKARNSKIPEMEREFINEQLDLDLGLNKI